MMARYPLIALASLLAWHSGRAQFAPATPLPGAPSFTALSAVDVDGDADNDLLGLFDGEQFKWFANTDGNGDFSVALDVVATGGPIGRWTTGDLDGDGLVDIVAMDAAETTVSWFRNLGDAAFGTAAVIGSLPAAPAVIRLADITGEGFPDIVFVIDQGLGGDIHWFPNIEGGIGPLNSAGLGIDGAFSSILLAGDMDLVGGIDLVVSNWNQTVFALRNTEGDASVWQVDTLINGSSFPYGASAELVDVDNDSDLDLADAGTIALHWAENHIGEGGAWSQFTDHELEPWLTAGIGRFTSLGCNQKAGVVYVPSNPSLPVQWTAWVDALGGFAHRTELNNVPRGSDLLVADLTGDGQAELVLITDQGTSWYRNQVVPPTSVLDLPALPPLCLYGDPFTLPEATPAGGQWSGFNVFDGALFRSNLQGTGTYPLIHSVYEPEGCPIGATASILVTEQPVISPTVSGVICSGDEPVQITSVPAATAWVGLEPDGTLDPATYEDGVFIAVFEDVTGTVCATESQPIEVWNSLQASIAATGPFCVNAGPQLIIAAQAPSIGVSWSGDISSWNSAGATFLPSQGAGTYEVVLHADPLGPYECGATDTLLVVVSDEFPEVDVVPSTPLCAHGDPVDLAPLATPIGGIWSGPGMNGSAFNPQNPGAGSYVVSYTYFAPNGCATSAALALEVLDQVQVDWSVGQAVYCESDPPTQFEAVPAGGTWSAPLNEDGVLDPSTLAPGSYTLVYAWTAVNGCTLQSSELTVERWNTTVPEIDPVGLLCDDLTEVTITGNLVGTWNGSASGEGAFVVFQPALLGAGTWPLQFTAAAPGECPGTTTVDLIVEVCTGLGMPRTPTIGVAPNPFQDRTQIDLGTSGISGFDVIDATGRTVVTTQGPIIGPFMVDLSGEAPGPYLLRTRLSSGAIETVRLLKQ